MTARILSVIALVVVLLALSAPVFAQDAPDRLLPVPEPRVVIFQIHLPFVSR